MCCGSIHEGQDSKGTEWKALYSVNLQEENKNENSHGILS